MKIEGHSDKRADIAWLRFEDYDPTTVIAKEVEFGVRELHPSDRRVVGLEYWHASRLLPAELLKMLPSPPLDVAR